MFLDLSVTETWDRLGDRLREPLGLTPDESARPFAGTPAAVMETVLTLAQIYSHKRSLAWVKGTSPAFDHLIPWFSKEAYSIQQGLWPDVRGGVQAWVDGLKKETAFVLFTEDHPVTGESWNWDELDNALNEKRIFSIRVSHSGFLANRDVPRPYSLRICSIAPDLAVAIGGSRWRITPMVANRQAWDIEATVARVKSRWAEATSPFLIESFEKEFAEQNWFAGKTDRVLDRAVLAFEDVAGEALLDRLKTKLGTAFPAGAADTSHLCRWDSLRLMKNWWLPPPADEKLRGLVVFSVPLLETKDFAKILRQAHEELRSQQSW